MKNLQNVYKGGGADDEKIHNRLDIYKVDGDILALIDQIDESAEPYGQFFSVTLDARLKDVKKLAFSSESKYLICYGNKNASFIKLEGDDGKPEFLSYKFQLEIKSGSKVGKYFDKILDI